VKLAAYYEKQLSAEQVNIYSEQLSQNLTDVECAYACRLYINDPKNEFFPRPVSKLIALIKSPVSAEDIGQNVSSKLLEAERSFGIHWADGHFQNGRAVYQGKDCAYESWRHAALSVFGATGLQVVDRYGGWKEFCMNVYESPDGVVRAQIKNLAIALNNIATKTGSYDSILDPRLNSGLTSAGNILNFERKKDD
jgi:predicted Zn-dependent protease